MSDSPINLGIDAGGSKTDLLIPQGSGPPRLFTAGPANPSNTSLSAVFSQLSNFIESSLASVSLDPGLIGTVCIGMAGLNTQAGIDQAGALLRSLPDQSRRLFGRTVILVNDAYLGLQAGTDTAFGVCVIAGTGAHCYGVDQTGRSWSAGNWGYLLGDQHSGFTLGRQIAQLVMQEYDGRRPESVITQQVLQGLNLKSPAQLYDWLIAQANPVRELASLTKLLNQPGFRSQPDIVKLVGKVIDALVISYQAVVTKLDLDSVQALPVVLLGGLFNLTDPFLLPVKARLMKVTPKADIHFLTQPPAAGALKIAASWTPDTRLPYPSIVLSG